MRIIFCLSCFLVTGIISFPIAASGQKIRPVKKVSESTYRKAVLDYDYLYCRVIETPAEFPSCDTGWNRFLFGTIDAALPGRNGAPPGVYIVEVWCVVLKDGFIETINVVSTCGFGMEEEVMRAIRQSPKWQPASRNGRRMGYRMKQYFRFLVKEPLIT